MKRVSKWTAVLWFLASTHVFAQTGPKEHWVTSWAAASVLRPQAGTTSPPAQPPAGAPQAPAPPPITINNQTVRQIVHLSLGGMRTRVVVTNVFGTAPLMISKASIALRDKETKIVPASAHALSFSGRPSATIPPGAVMYSDPVSMSVPALSDVVVDLFFADDLSKSPSPLTIHPGANQTNYISSPGDFTSAADFGGASKLASWVFLAGIEVAAPQQMSAVVTFGDSITDGTRSTPDTNERWPDRLAKRLAATTFVRAVVNSGIAANRVLGDVNATVFPFGFNAGINALARFDRDVLAQPGITHVIVLEGINDIGLARQNPSPSADDLIAGYRQMIERAHAHGLKVYGGTLLPFEGANYFSAEGEAKRQAVNDWIRKNSPYDGVVDFDAAVRDPAQPSKMLAKYDSGDHLHPNDAGYEAMGDAIDLRLFGSAAAQPSGKSKKQSASR